jgi:hypothetical protein
LKKLNFFTSGGQGEGAWRFAHSEYLDPPQKLFISEKFLAAGGIK